jgi:hypothetical protein
MRTRWGCETQRHYAYAKSEVYGLDLRTLNIMYVGSVGHSCLAVPRGRQSRVTAEIGNVWKLAVRVRLLCLTLFTYIGDSVSASLVSRVSFL